MGIRVPVDVGECPRDADFRGSLVEACRSESACVGVGWGQEWGQRSKSNWWLPVPGMSPAITTGHHLHTVV